MRPKPIVCVKVKRKYYLRIKGFPLVEAKDATGKSYLTWEGRPGFEAPGSADALPRHWFPSKESAMGTAHKIGRYALGLGDMVFAYVDNETEVK